jgi:hypothetical protein
MGDLDRNLCLSLCAARCVLPPRKGEAGKGSDNSLNIETDVKAAYMRIRRLPLCCHL